MTIYVRPARAADFPWVESLICAELRDHAARRPDLFYSDGAGYGQEEFQALLADSGAIALAAEVDGDLAGICLGRVAPRRESPVFRPGLDAELEDVAVFPAFRRRGVARRLLEAAKVRAAELGAERLGLRVWEFNAGALALYRAMGFQMQWSKLEAECEKKVE